MLNVLESKTCIKCKRLKTFEEFHLDRSRVDQRQKICKQCYSEHRKIKNAEPAEKARKLEQSWRYRGIKDLTIAQFEQAVRLQNNICRLCGKVLDVNKCADHNHSTGEFRGVLCRGCNASLGVVENLSAERRRRINEYLGKSILEVNDG